ncbi:oligopeptide ABC transporter ATP-binding protein OppF [Spiroplasma taiwanense]|uniref:Oligopeptide ABC transporter ATP-binding protein n=1 Tax=Spiroplasma taiwanense CT-1 TaxID=1276220 RepID=S5M0D2_9MOLU|nr:oligopeptide ABC transporter ATP-binding protein OppF [Spiroplasma taiwanense]AGR41452.1 oligopeptide ABC transporter ATP-binding protein [Spiroplasma taiwanense CT-1]
MSIEINKDVLLNIRDIVIEFRNKGKKFNAVKETSFDIYKGEIFGLVGESGSGKTTIGRAIVGVQPLKNGAIYMEDSIVVGKPTSLYNLNKEISKKVDNMSLKMDITTQEIQSRIKALKEVYNKFKNNLSLDIEKELEMKLKAGKLTYLNGILLSNLKYINKIIKNEDKMIKFVDNLNSYIPELSKKLETSVISKLKETKEAVLDLKENAENIYKICNNIAKEREKYFKLKSKNVEETFKILFALWKEMVENHKEFLAKLVWVKEMQFQLHALSAPLKSREKFINYYNKLLYVRRDDFFQECNKQLKILESNNTDFNDLEFKKINYFKTDFWSRKNMNLNNCKKILKIFENQNIDYSQLEILSSSLKNTEFEDKLKLIIKEKKSITENQLKQLKDELKSIEKIIEKNIIKDKELIEYFYKWKGIERNYTEEEIQSFIELSDFLELPSIDEIVKKSFFFQKQTKKEKREIRKNIQMIFQDPGSSLNDRMAIEEIIAEGMENFPELYKGEIFKELYVKEFNEQNPDSMITIEQATPNLVKKHIILKLIKSVGLLPEHLSRYPHEFSGGQRQRVGIARSLAMKPKLIIADEPISALDVSIRAQVLNLFKKFQEELDLTYVFIAHDLSVVRHIADRIAVIYHGEIVELAPAEELFRNPLHPYTKALLSAIPIPVPELAKQTELIVYIPEEEHRDYIFDLPYFKEVLPGHFVWANKREIREIKRKLK